MTPNREDYLKTIYASNLLGDKITNKNIAEELSVSPPSVTEMVQKLIEAGLIVKDSKLGFVLTDQGTRGAQNVLKKHRLWEVFLVSYLGYTWDNVHDDAEVLEHATSDLLADRLNEFLNHPEYCPHGSIIFGNATEHSEIKYPLSELSVGEYFMIREVSDHRRFLNYMKSKELAIGMSLEVRAIDEYDGTRTLISPQGREYQISDIATKEMLVERLEERV